MDFQFPSHFRSFPAIPVWRSPLVRWVILAHEPDWMRIYEAAGPVGMIGTRAVCVHWIPCWDPVLGFRAASVAGWAGWAGWIG